MTIVWWQAAAANFLLYGFVAIAAHLMMSLGQTLFHRYLGHHPGRALLQKSYRHSSYRLADNHLVSNRRPSLNGNNTPFFLIPSIIVIGIGYWAMPFDFLSVLIAAMSLSFGAHVYLDRRQLSL